jgi:hypothetical protein
LLGAVKIIHAICNGLEEANNLFELASYYSRQAIANGVLLFSANKHSG